MAGGVVTIGKRQYACGLYWENSPSGRVSQAAKEAARQPSVMAKFYAARAGKRDGRVPQFGLSQGDPHKAGMPVLSACLANQQPGSWAGAFRFREGVAVIVVRDDLIVPDGDLFFTDETEARDRLLQEMALGGIQKVYAPETWGISGADSMPVSLLLNDSTEVKLKSVSISQQSLIVLGGLGFILLLLLGIGLYLQKIEAEKKAAELAAKEALERAKMEASQFIPGLAQGQPQYPPPKRVWEEKPKAMDVIMACYDALNKAQAVIAGWRLDSVKCDGNSLTQKWNRNAGFSLLPKDFVIDETGSLATKTVVLPALKNRGAEDLLDPNEITRRFLFQNWPGNLGRAQDDPPPPPPAGYNGPWNPPPPPWVKRSFTLSVPQLPWLLPEFLADMPGVVIDSLSLQVSGIVGNWTVQGVIYENRR